MRTICTLLLSMLIQLTFAYDFESGGIYYNYISDTEVEVTHNGIGSYNGNIVIPDIVNGYTVTRIGNKAFTQSFPLYGSSLTLPNYLESIGDSAFYISLLKTITIPARVKTIGNCVFASSLLESITLPVGLKSIGKFAFGGSYLKSITLPAGLTSIGEGAFNGCYLENVTIPKGVTSIGESAFSYMKTPLTITFEEGITTIQKSILTGNSKPLTVNLPSTLKTIETYAFAWSNGLESITLPNNLNTIGDNAFFRTGLKSITVPGSVKNLGKEILCLCNKLTTAIIEEGVQTISEGMFNSCSALTDVSIANSVTQILHESFRDCNSLVSISLPNNLEKLKGGAFSGCSSLESIMIPKSCIDIPNNSFRECSALKSIVVEEGNPNYDSRENCNAIIQNNTLITGCNGTIIPKSIDTLGPGAFSGCSFSTIDIPSNITVISHQAFLGCANLTNIEIPYNVSVIGERAFAECPNLTTVISHIKKPFNILSNVFFNSPEYNMGINQDAILYVPSGTKSKYEATNGWKEFKNIEEMQSVEPVQTETIINTNSLNGQNLSNNIIDDVYYNIGSEGYDSSDGSVVINQPTDMSQISDATPGSNDVKNNFNGLILKVAAGKGLIKVNAKTTGNAQLVVQVGNQTPMIATKTVQGDVVVSYNVTEDTYVYIYAIIGNSAAPALRSAGNDVVKIYSITVTPGATGILSIDYSPLTIDHYYTLDGRKIKGVPTKKGIFIVNGRKVVMK